MSGQNKEIKMAATALGYNNNNNLPNRDSSSSSSPNQTSSDQPQFKNNNPPKSFLCTPPPQHPTTDPDLTPSPQVTTATATRTVAVLPPTAQNQTRATKIWYRECLRNHAASMGSYVVDGCGEFMPSGEQGTPESLKCAACECHCNFHRKDVEGEHSQHQHVYYPNNNNTSGVLHFPTPSLSLPRFSSHVSPIRPVVPPPLMMAFGGPAAESSIEDLNIGGALSVHPQTKKRVRTKFSQQQKDRMLEFADKLGWKIPKHDEQEVHQFCSQLGIKRHVFKVWMHNNKQAVINKQPL